MENNNEHRRKELNNLIELLNKIDESKKLLESKVDKQRYWGARSMLNNLSEYNQLIAKVKDLITPNVNDLEKKAVDTLVKEGYGCVTETELLKKYGYIKEKK